MNSPVEPLIKESKELNWVKKNIDLGSVMTDKALFMEYNTR